MKTRCKQCGKVMHVQESLICDKCQERKYFGVFYRQVASVNRPKPKFYDERDNDA